MTHIDKQSCRRPGRPVLRKTKNDQRDHVEHVQILRHGPRRKGSHLRKRCVIVFCLILDPHVKFLREIGRQYEGSLPDCAVSDTR